MKIEVSVITHPTLTASQRWVSQSLDFLQPVEMAWRSRLLWIGPNEVGGYDDSRFPCGIVWWNFWFDSVPTSGTRYGWVLSACEPDRPGPRPTNQGSPGLLLDAKSQRSSLVLRPFISIGRSNFQVRPDNSNRLFHTITWNSTLVITCSRMFDQLQQC